MSYNFKKIIDLELVNEVPEGANVLIETDGATKRLPSTAIKSEGCGMFVVETQQYSDVLRDDLSFEVIYDAIMSGKPVYYCVNGEYYPLNCVSSNKIIWCRVGCYGWSGELTVVNYVLTKGNNNITEEVVSGTLNPIAGPA